MAQILDFKKFKKRKIKEITLEETIIGDGDYFYFETSNGERKDPEAMDWFNLVTGALEIREIKEEE